MFIKRVSPIIQRVFGAALLFFGLNKVFSFFPIPEKEGFAKVFLDAVDGSGYIMFVIMIVQILAGIALLVNRYVALALVVMFPITLNIFLFHVLHDRDALIPTVVLMAWNSLLILANRQKYSAILSPR